MYTHTLAGIFPEPKPMQKRNFLKENVRQIKQMQGTIRGTSEDRRLKVAKDKFQTIPNNKNGTVRKNTTYKTVKVAQKSSLDLVPAGKKSLDKNLKKGKKQKTQKTNTNLNPEEVCIKNKDTSGISSFRRTDKFITRGIQTERTDNLEKFLETGVIKYPSALGSKSPNKKSPNLSPGKRLECGDAPLNSPICQIFDNENAGGDLHDKINNLNLQEKHDYIKENILALKSRVQKKDTGHDPSQVPPNYQKGHVPKYLKDRREEQKKEIEKLDLDCPEGHVLLPDEERKETLRVLRQSYADRIQELNSMPVRNDTLRMRKRKMEIEEELKKIDEGIKVFQRPKVYVKINA